MSHKFRGQKLPSLTAVTCPPACLFTHLLPVSCLTGHPGDSKANFDNLSAERCLKVLNVDIEQYQAVLDHCDFTS